VIAPASTRAQNPERAAWTVLLGAFFTFVLLVGTLVFGGRWWLQNASVEQSITMTVGDGATVFVTRPGRSAPEVNITAIPVGSEIRTESTAQASLNFVSADGKQVLGTVRVFGSSVLVVTEADSPRYNTGIAPHHISLHLVSGRVRATVGVDVVRPVQMVLVSEPGTSTLLDQPGSNASVQVDATNTMVTVRDGQATVSAGGQSVVLIKDQRAQVAPNSAPSAALPAEQNLIVNGDFTQPLTGTWSLDTRQPQDPTEQVGTANVTTDNGRRTIHIQRTGNNWGHVGRTQDINRDVQGLTSLRLSMDIQIDGQDVRNCGVQGTECPLMVKINYVDVGGGAHEWLQGFYTFFDPSPSAGLTFCLPCFPVQYKHMLWSFAAWQSYTSDDLLQIFANSGTPPAVIKSITIYGEGHTFDSQFADVQLLANE
jgi:hypothetical protein